MEDEKVAQVANITGATPALANQYLALAEGDENQAVVLFFENDGADLGVQTFPSSVPPPPQHAAPATRSISGPYHDAGGVINIDSDDEGETGHVSDDDGPQIIGTRQLDHRNARNAQDTPPHNFQDPSFDADAALAARLQEEAYAGQEQGDDIRAPIARQAQTLLGPGVDEDIDESAMPAHIRRHMEQLQSRHTSGRL